jgi:hypothetical protein
VRAIFLRAVALLVFLAAAAEAGLVTADILDIRGAVVFIPVAAA